MRGEYAPLHIGKCFNKELPPRARRIHLQATVDFETGGTTSACAENTLSPLSFSCLIWNYLRVRGEYLIRGSSHQHPTELPPRARRIRLGQAQGYRRNGTTSACAENTLPLKYSPQKNGNYLRVRGEYRLPPYSGVPHPELPPRARRIHRTNHSKCSHSGTTSACAENTLNELGLL